MAVFDGPYKCSFCRVAAEASRIILVRRKDMEQMAGLRERFLKLLRYPQLAKANLLTLNFRLWSMLMS